MTGAYAFLFTSCLFGFHPKVENCSLVERVKGGRRLICWFTFLIRFGDFGLESSLHLDSVNFYRFIVNRLSNRPLTNWMSLILLVKIEFGWKLLRTTLA